MYGYQSMLGTLNKNSWPNLTHCGLVTLYGIIGSGNGLLPVRRQATTRTNDNISAIWILAQASVNY